MNEIYRPKADIVTIQFGANDCNIWDSDFGVERVNERSYYYNLIEMIRKIRSHGTHGIILLTTHLKPGDTVVGYGETLESYNHRLAMYNELVREVSSVWGTTLCDMEHSINKTDVLPENGKYIHLSWAGNRKYGRAISSLLEKTIKEL
jgi:lysophospholipase L1-like esterase